MIVVDWNWLASDTIYFNSAYNTRIVGERVGEFIVYLRKTRFIKSYKSVHMVGFSLGAHVAGYAAKHVKKTVKIRVARVTGIKSNLWLPSNCPTYCKLFNQQQF